MTATIDWDVEGRKAQWERDEGRASSDDIFGPLHILMYPSSRDSPSAISPVLHAAIFCKHALIPADSDAGRSPARRYEHQCKDRS
jgi:hypothetical protein